MHWLNRQHGLLGRRVDGQGSRGRHDGNGMRFRAYEQCAPGYGGTVRELPDTGDEHDLTFARQLGPQRHRVRSDLGARGYRQVNRQGVACRVDA